MARLIGMIAVVAIAFLTCSAQTSAQQLRPEEFNTLQRLIKPTADELKWEQIPWMTDLWEARRKADTEGKPIFLWSMDGNPLGCS